MIFLGVWRHQRCRGFLLGGFKRHFFWICRLCMGRWSPITHTQGERLGESWIWFPESHLHWTCPEVGPVLSPSDGLQSHSGTPTICAGHAYGTWMADPSGWFYECHSLQNDHWHQLRSSAHPKDLSLLIDQNPMAISSASGVSHTILLGRILAKLIERIWQFPSTKLVQVRKSACGNAHELGLNLMRVRTSISTLVRVAPVHVVWSSDGYRKPWGLTMPGPQADWALIWSWYGHLSSTRV